MYLNIHDIHVIQNPIEYIMDFFFLLFLNILK